MEHDALTPWLTFPDAGLELAYRDDAAWSGQRAARWVVLVVLVVTAGLGLIDPETSGSPANLVVFRSLRFGLAVPLLLFATVAAWCPPPRWARLAPWAMGASTAAALWTAPLMTLLVPDADQLDLRSGPMAITTALVAICAGMPVLGQKWVVTAAIALAAGIACAVVTTLKFRVPEAGAIAVWYLGATFAGVLSAYIIEQSRRRAFAARRRSETLLHNVLPEVVATRLKRDPSPIADRFEDVTVLFGDIVGFTPMSASMSPEELVASLDRVFTAFDALAERHGLEKIKTIGDAYMVVGGVPTPRVDHAEAIARMAIGMRQVIAEMDFPGGVRLEMRIGIHSGSVVAGVIGRKKFSYDLWGDTVNTASRMESHGEPGEIHVSDATQARLASRFVLRDRGLMHVKGKGELRTWFLDGAR